MLIIDQRFRLTKTANGTMTPKQSKKGQTRRKKLQIPKVMTRLTLEILYHFSIYCNKNSNIFNTLVGKLSKKNMIDVTGEGIHIGKKKLSKDLLALACY